mgnify:CR=1 FL=1
MSSPYCLNLPLNSVSFGQVSVAILREIFKRGEHPPVFPIGPVDLSTQTQDAVFTQWLQACINTAQQRHNRQNTAYKLWHIPGSLESYSSVDSRLLTFQESGQLTPTELNILRQQQRVYVTNRYAQTFFKQFGIDATYVPLGFDAHNFRVLEKRPSIEGVTSWLLTSKAENRKHTYRQLSLWAKRYGNQKEHRLNLAISNHFLSQENQDKLIAQALGGERYWNINRLGFCATNAEYNSLLQSSEIILCCSGSEGFGLPEFHATAMGAWPVAMKAHAYLDYFTDENAVLVTPNGMAPIYDGIFFQQGAPTSQGNIYTFADEDFYAACEEAQKRLISKGLNIKGLDLQSMKYSTSVETLLQ